MAFRVELLALSVLFWIAHNDPSVICVNIVFHVFLNANSIVFFFHNFVRLVIEQNMLFQVGFGV